MVVGEIETQLTLDTKQFVEGLKKAQAAIEEIAKGFAEAIARFEADDAK